VNRKLDDNHERYQNMKIQQLAATAPYLAVHTSARPPSYEEETWRLLRKFNKYIMDCVTGFCIEMFIAKK